MTGHANTGVHPTALGEGAQPHTSTQSIDATTNTTTSASESYPEQKHAGAVGIGPNYHHGPTTGDKLTGMKEQIKGSVTRNAELQQQGKDRRTGELQRRHEHGHEESPFEDPSKKEHVEEAARAATVSAEGTHAGHHQQHGGNIERQKNFG
jgi:hypothetical protein